uniref:Nucleotide-diphospho-sugar transferase domain-containing protein n=1 Tax=Pristionchus pacificus TaxID=54126 RepID=A0A8R1U9K6_PRIPA
MHENYTANTMTPRGRLIILFMTIAACLVIVLKISASFKDEIFDVVPVPFTISAEPRTNKSLDIAIVIVLTKGSDMGNYKSALYSIEKYSALHGYQLLVEFDTKYSNCSRHNDKFFRRHCHTHELMLNQLNESSYILFIDADVGVVNPNKLIDEFIQPEFDIYLYNRFYNWEYAAQYIVKNNERGRNWVKMWAEMEFTLPKSFHGSDNGSLHMLMLNYLVPEIENGESRIGQMCRSIWERSVNTYDLFTMQACTRMVIGERSEFPEHHVKIFQKGHGWARDIWLLKSRWSTDDFMLHSIKEQRLDYKRIGPHNLNFLLIFTEKDKFNYALAFPVMNVTTTENGQIWTMDGRLQISNSWRTNLFRRLSMLKWQEQVVIKEEEVEPPLILPPAVPREIMPIPRINRRIECYAAIHGYGVSIGYDNTYKECVVHQKLFFRRHCHAYMEMKHKLAENEWILFIDADIGVVNPNKYNFVISSCIWKFIPLIEEYIEPGYEIYVFDRFFNWEVYFISRSFSLNSYLVKNNERGRTWVKELADYEFNVPDSFHGEDNGALHPLMLKWLVPEQQNRLSDLCMSIWNRSHNYVDIYAMHACTRVVIGEHTHFPEHKMQIISKGHAWAQDLWLLNSHWSTDNFMMHAIKEKNFNKTATLSEEVRKLGELKIALIDPLPNITLPSPFNGISACDVVFPVLNKLDIGKCRNHTEKWEMESRLEIDIEERTEMLGQMADILMKRQMEAVGNMTERLQIDSFLQYWD